MTTSNEFVEVTKIGVYELQMLRYTEDPITTRRQIIIKSEDCIYPLDYSYKRETERDLAFDSWRIIGYWEHQHIILDRPNRLIIQQGHPPFACNSSSA